jgi:hypothetical protein
MGTAMATGQCDVLGATWVIRGGYSLFRSEQLGTLKVSVHKDRRRRGAAGMQHRWGTVWHCEVLTNGCVTTRAQEMSVPVHHMGQCHQGCGGGLAPTAGQSI